MSRYLLSTAGEQKPHAVLAMVTEVIEKSTIAYVINKTGGNISKASQILGVTRATLRKKISTTESIMANRLNETNYQCLDLGLQQKKLRGFQEVFRKNIVI